jgi:hypothetical protein
VSRNPSPRALLVLALVSLLVGGLLWTQALGVGVLLDVECRRAPTAGVCPWLPRAIYVGIAMQLGALPLAVLALLRYLRSPAGDGGARLDRRAMRR